MTPKHQLRAQYLKLTEGRQGIALLADGEDWWVFGDAATQTLADLKGAPLSHSIGYTREEPALRFHRADFETVVKVLVAKRARHVIVLQPSDPKVA